VWTGKDDVDHCYTVGSYVHYAGQGRLSPPRARDLSPGPTGDPLYVVYALRAADGGTEAAA
jgi:hypothetical protein